MHANQPRDGYESSRLWHIIEAALEYFISIMVGGVYLARITKGLGFSDGLTGILSSFFLWAAFFSWGRWWFSGRKGGSDGRSFFCS